MRMERKYSKLKEEIMDLFGTISVDEIIINKPLSKLMVNISNSLSGISIVERYQPQERI